MRLFVVGVNERTAPLKIRERLAFDPASLPDALRRLHADVPEAMILTTCNRVEIYAAMPEPRADAGCLRRFLAAWHGLDEADLTPWLSVHTGEEAVRHLFRLAAGLDSMVLGEDQILAQIKDAYADAHGAGTAGTYLHRLVHAALESGKLARSRTAIARNHISVVSVGLDMARATLGTLRGRRAVVVGAGRTAELTLQHLRREQPSFVILNRSLPRAADLAVRYGGEAGSLDRLATALVGADLVVATTSSPEPLVPAGTVAAALAEQPRPIVLLDLAVPRDVEPAAGALPGVQLIDVEAMRSVCDANRLSRSVEIDRAAALVEDGVARFLAWHSSRRSVPAIRALRGQGESVRAAELERALARMPNLSDRERRIVAAMSRSIVNKLLHTPTVGLRSAQDEQLAAAARLFHLDDVSPATTSPQTGDQRAIDA